MKNILLLSLIALCLGFTQTATAQTAPVGLAVGDKAPDFAGKNQSGKTIHLKDYLKKGPVVVVFYRGQWCPYCNLYLKTLQDSFAVLSAKGAQVVAITPELPQNVAKTLEKTKAEYDVISDNSNKIMDSYKVTYAVTPELDAKMKGYGVDLNAANGQTKATLPVPATYIIDRSGKVIFRQFDPDYRHRASVAQLANALTLAK